MKKFLSLLMAMAVVAISAFTVTAIPVKASSTMTIYYQNTGWYDKQDATFCYAFSGPTDYGAWQTAGTAMTPVGNGWYKRTFSPTADVQVVFSCADGQTSNSDVLSASNSTYWVTNSTTDAKPKLTATTTKPDGFAEQTVNWTSNAKTTTETVYYYNADKWSNLSYYAMGVGVDTMTWPGKAMTSCGNDWYKCTLTVKSPFQIIFNNGKATGALQTGNSPMLSQDNLTYWLTGTDTLKAVSVAPSNFSSSSPTSSTTPTPTSSDASTTPSDTSTSSTTSTTSSVASTSSTSSPDTGDCGSMVVATIIGLAALTGTCAFLSKKKSK